MNTNHFNYNTNSNVFNSIHPSTMKNSKSDYDAFKVDANSNQNIDNFFNSSINDLRNITLGNDSFMDSLDLFNNSNNTSTHLSYPSLYPHVEIININDFYSSLKSSPPSSPSPASPVPHSFASYSVPAAAAPFSIQPDVLNANNQTHYNQNQNNNNNYQFGNNNSYSYNTPLGSNSFVGTLNQNPISATMPPPPTTSSSTFTSNYSKILSATLASTPGVTITPLNQQQQSNAGSNLFGYGFYDTTNDFNSSQCKLEVSTRYTNVV